VTAESLKRHEDLSKAPDLGFKEFARSMYSPAGALVAEEFRIQRRMRPWDHVVALARP
jgi:hypothetical protein